MFTYAADGGYAVWVTTAGATPDVQTGLIRVHDASDNYVIQLNGADGSITGTTKSFRMDHPLDSSKEIYYVSLEGPEAGAYTRGTAQLVGGEATIRLPEHFTLVAGDEGMTVHLTALSAESEGLVIDVQRGVALFAEHALTAPVLKESGGASVAVTLVTISRLVAIEDQSYDVRRVLLVECVLEIRRDHVIGRGYDITERADVP